LAAAALMSSPPLGLAAGGGGDNIFELKTKKLDSAQFWIILAGMVFYGLLIDRVQYFTQRAVENSRCSKMIFERTVTEFMVFGIVAITMFIGTNLDPHLDEKYPYCTTHLTYADVLVSFAACSLIVLGALYSWMRHRTEEHLQGFQGDEHKDTVIPRMGTWRPMNLKQQSVFLERKNLTTFSFNWNLYFQESLAHQICDLINITWVTWLVTFIVLLPMVVYKGFLVTDAAKTAAYINGFLFTTWFFLLLTLATVIQIRLLRGKLYAAVDGYLKATRVDEVDEDSEDEDNDTDDLEVVDKSMEWWSDFLAWLMQFESLCICFILGMYVMHLSYNLKVYGHDLSYPVLWYHLGFLLPLLLSLVVLFPLGLVELTSIQAFSAPDQEVLHTIIAETRQAHTDLVFIQSKIMSLGSSKTEAAQEKARTILINANGGDDTVKRMDMIDLLVSIDVHLTKQRSLAVFDLVDQEHEATGVTRNNTVALKVKNCLEDAIDRQVPIDDLLDSAARATMDGNLDNISGSSTVKRGFAAGCATLLGRHSLLQNGLSQVAKAEEVVEN